MEKTLFKIVLNWYGESFTYHRYASTKTGAFMFALRAHAEIMQRTLYSVKGYYDGSKDNYLITKAERR